MVRYLQVTDNQVAYLIEDAILYIFHFFESKIGTAVMCLQNYDYDNVSW